MAKAKSLSVFQAGLLVAGLVLVPILITLLFITPKDNIKEQGMRALLPPRLKNSIISSQVHLDAYAKELGELQARMMRLDAQSQRLAKLASGNDTRVINNPNFKSRADSKSPSNVKSSANSNSRVKITIPAPDSSAQLDGRGGPLVSSRPMTELGLQAAIVELTKAVDVRDESLSSLEAKILQQSVLKDMLPNSSPVDAGFIAATA